MKFRLKQRPNPALNADRPTAALLGSLRAARSGGRLAPRYALSIASH